MCEYAVSKTVRCMMFFISNSTVESGKRQAQTFRFEMPLLSSLQTI